jgi:plasmid stabilization system protein ParE
VTVRFLEVARIELRDAARFYEAQRRGLGAEFRDEVRSTLERIKRFPHAWQALSENSRRCQTRRFPYGVIYRVEAEEILVVAIAHLHRRPGYWTDRF